MQALRLGTRGSKLAIWQAEYVAGELSRRVPEMAIEIVTIKTKGDKILDVPLAKIGDKGLFTREIENELLDGNIDLAVHSMKDLPSVMGEGLALGAVLPRENQQDVLISAQGNTLQNLPAGAVIGTSSLRRIAQLKALRPDLEVVNMRGNVETRIRKMEEQGLDGIILAYAGVKRLGFEQCISEIIAVEKIMPAVGQGAIAIQIRANDLRTRQLIEAINDERCWLETTAERAFLAQLEGGCQVPVACMAQVVEQRIMMAGLVSSLDGKQVFRASAECDFTQIEITGRQLAVQLMEAGAASILEEIKLLGD